jgi:hypothetical protein
MEQLLWREEAEGVTYATCRRRARRITAARAGSARDAPRPAEVEPACRSLSFDGMAPAAPARVTRAKRQALRAVRGERVGAVPG